MNASSATGRTTAPVRGRFRQPDEYGLALVLILATIVAIAVLGDKPYGQLLAAALSGTTLLFILQTSQVRQRTMRIAIAIVLLALLGTTVAVFVQNGFVDGTAYGLMIGFIAVVSPFVIGRRLLGHTVITLRTVAGALCLYLLVGLFFATVYGLLSQLDSGFFVQTDAPTGTDLIYFSFITLTTTGYGDFTAASDLGRMLAVTEALFGQLYLVSAVALLIGSLGRSRGTRSSTEPDVLDELGALADVPAGDQPTT